MNLLRMMETLPVPPALLDRWREDVIRSESGVVQDADIDAPGLSFVGAIPLTSSQRVRRAELLCHQLGRGMRGRSGVEHGSRGCGLTKDLLVTYQRVRVRNPPPKTKSHVKSNAALPPTLSDSLEETEEAHDESWSTKCLKSDLFAALRRRWNSENHPSREIERHRVVHRQGPSSAPPLSPLHAATTMNEVLQFYGVAGVVLYTNVRVDEEPRGGGKPLGEPFAVLILSRCDEWESPLLPWELLQLLLETAVSFWCASESWEWSTRRRAARAAGEGGGGIRVWVDMRENRAAGSAPTSPSSSSASNACPTSCAAWNRAIQAALLRPVAECDESRNSALSPPFTLAPLLSGFSSLTVIHVPLSLTVVECYQCLSKRSGEQRSAVEAVAERLLPFFLDEAPPAGNDVVKGAAPRSSGEGHPEHPPSQDPHQLVPLLELAAEWWSPPAGPMDVEKEATAPPVPPMPLAPPPPPSPFDDSSVGKKRSRSAPPKEVKEARCKLLFSPPLHRERFPFQLVASPFTGTAEVFGRRAMDWLLSPPPFEVIFWRKKAVKPSLPPKNDVPQGRKSAKAISEQRFAEAAESCEPVPWKPGASRSGSSLAALSTPSLSSLLRVAKSMLLIYCPGGPVWAQHSLRLLLAVWCTPASRVEMCSHDSEDGTPTGYARITPRVPATQRLVLLLTEGGEAGTLEELQGWAQQAFCEHNLMFPLLVMPVMSKRSRAADNAGLGQEKKKRRRVSKAPAAAPSLPLTAQMLDQMITAFHISMESSFALLLPPTAVSQTTVPPSPAVDPTSAPPPKKKVRVEKRVAGRKKEEASSSGKAAAAAAVDDAAKKPHESDFDGMLKAWLLTDTGVPNAASKSSSEQGSRKPVVTRKRMPASHLFHDVGACGLAVLSFNELSLVHRLPTPIELPGASPSISSMEKPAKARDRRVGGSKRSSAPHTAEEAPSAVHPIPVELAPLAQLFPFHSQELAFNGLPLTEAVAARRAYLLRCLSTWLPLAGRLQWKAAGSSAGAPAKLRPAIAIEHWRLRDIDPTLDSLTASATPWVNALLGLVLPATGLNHLLIQANLTREMRQRRTHAPAVQLPRDGVLPGVLLFSWHFFGKDALSVAADLTSKYCESLKETPAVDEENRLFTHFHCGADGFLRYRVRCMARGFVVVHLVIELQPLIAWAMRVKEAEKKKRRKKVGEVLPDVFSFRSCTCVPRKFERVRYGTDGVKQCRHMAEVWLLFMHRLIQLY